VLLITAGVRAEETIEPAAAMPEAAFSPAQDSQAAPAADLAPLRRLHEGAYFLLKRYAMMEALTAAVDHGRSENQAFAVGTASWIPGVGQFINGDNLQGGLLLGAAGMSSLTIRQLEFTRRQRPGTGDLLPVYYGLLAVRNGVMAYAMLHATNANYRARHDRTAALWTGTASILPGVGQAINGQWWEAAAFLAVYTGSALLTARVEEEIFPSGDDRSYWVRGQEGLRCQVACLPGGAALTLTTDW
jgi:hypothetical protein